jgi:hypothetical protein
MLKYLLRNKYLGVISVFSSIKDTYLFLAIAASPVSGIPQTCMQSEFIMIISLAGSR